MTRTLEIAAGTHAGMRRLHNEDCLATAEQPGYAVLADGLGGHNAGEVASRMAVDIVGSGLQAAFRSAELGARRAESTLSDLIAQANERIFAAAQANAAYSGMGTTIVVAVWHSKQVTVAHVGDSRLYRFRDNTLQQLTHDHSLAQEHIDRGTMSFATARAAGVRSILTRTVGNAPGIDADIDTFPTAPADIYLLCSDGLTDMLSDDEIAHVLEVHAVPLPRAVEALIRHANENGGEDNISVVLARVVA